MPLYDYKCECGFMDIDRKEHPDNMILVCPNCKGELKRLLPTKIYVNMGVGAYGYYDETLGTYINTNRQKRAEMAKQGVTEKGATPKEGQAWV